MPSHQNLRGIPPNDDGDGDELEPGLGRQPISQEGLSAQFEAELAQGTSPDLNRWLRRVPKNQRAEFLEKLNSLVRHYPSDQSGQRRSQRDDIGGEPPIDASLTDSIPQHSALSDTDLDVVRPFRFDSTTKSIGPYRIECELGRGGMGVVYRARHLERGDVVALKVLPQVDGASLHRFKREFRSLADISHPNLIGLRTLETEGKDWFFTMDLIENARSFRAYVRPNNQLDESRLRHCLSQLVDGVHALHEFGVLHRDLKASNVLIDGAGRVIIVDFGLVRELTRSDVTMTANGISGTPAYMAPESIGGGDETFACDWYSVGVMVYDALCGHLPFRGEAMQVLSDKRSKDAPPMQDAEDLPEDLSKLCMSLLQRDPLRRPNHNQIQDVLGSGTTLTINDGSIDDILLGRDWHLTTLRSHYERVHESGKAVAVFVSGKSGEGKSALVDRFLKELLRDEEVTLLAGRCYDRESVPFKALDSLIDALASHLRSLDMVDAALLLPDDTGFLAEVFPVLERVEVIAKREAPDVADLDEQQVRKRAFGALRELLRRISSKRRMIIFCDDLQWGDADSAEVLVDVLTGKGAPRLMLIGSYRVDEADESPFLQMWERLQQQAGDHRTETSEVPVGPLSFEHCERLVASQFSKLDEKTIAKLAREVFDETGGNAFFLSELLECMEIDGDNIRRIPLNEVLSQKLSRLPAEAAGLLNVTAVSGQALGQSEAIKASGLGQASFAVLSQMRNARLVRMLGDNRDLRIDTYHDKIRETVLASIGDQTRCQTHARLAEVFEADSPEISKETIDAILDGDDIEHPGIGRIYDLAVHFAGAKNHRKAAVYSFLAAEQARRQFSPEVASRQFANAFASEKDGLFDKCRFRMESGYANSLMLLGEYSKAIGFSEQSLLHAETSFDRAHAYELLGELSLKQARIYDAMRNYNAALREVGVWAPNSKVGFIAAALSQLVVHLFRSVFVRSNSEVPVPRVERLRLRVFAKAFYPGGFSNVPYCCWAIISGINRGERWAATREMGIQYSLYGCLAANIGLQQRAIRFVTRGIKIQEKLNDQFGVAHAFGWAGLMHFASGDYSKAVEYCQAGADNFKVVGDRWELNLIQFHHACSLFMLGRLDEAIVLAKNVFDRGKHYSDTRTHCALYILQRASEGTLEIQPYVEQIDQVDDDILSTCNLHKAIGLYHLNKGQASEAVEMFEQAWKRPLKEIVPHYHVMPGLPMMVNALRQRNGPTDLKRALKLARRTAMICRMFPTEYPSALREYGETLGVVGKHRKAMKYLEKSCAVAKKQKAAYELAKSKLALAKVQKLAGLPGAEKAIAEAESEMQRFSDLIDKGLREISSSDSR